MDINIIQVTVFWCDGETRVPLSLILLRRSTITVVSIVAAVGLAAVRSPAAANKDMPVVRFTSTADQTRLEGQTDRLKESLRLI